MRRTFVLVFDVRDEPLSHSLSPFLRGEGGMRGCFHEYGLDCKQNAFDIPEDIVVPEAKSLVALFPQTFIPDGICCGFIVLPSVDFDDEALLATDEIADVADDRFLAHKLMSVNASAADAVPENRLCVYLIDS
jgi:hypothetical protein